MDRGAWWATVHGVTESWIRLSDLSTAHKNILSSSGYSGEYSLK